MKAASSRSRWRGLGWSGWLSTIGIGALAIAWLLPLWMVVVNAMKTTPEYVRDTSPLTLPDDPLQLFRNIGDAWQTAGVGAGLGASMIYGTVGSTVAILFAALGAFALARLRVRWKFFWFALVFSASIFPIQMFLIPLFRLFQRTGLYDTRLGVTAVYVALSIPFCLFVLRGFFATVPSELHDAARLDADDLRVFLYIFLPLARAPIAVLFLFQFTWIWNDLAFGLILSASDGVRPITPGLSGMQGIYSSTGPTTVLAGALLGTIPTVLLFLLLSRQVLTGLILTTGAKVSETRFQRPEAS